MLLENPDQFPMDKSNPTQHLEKHRKEEEMGLFMIILLTVAQTKRHVHAYLITQLSCCFNFSTCCQQH